MKNLFPLASVVVLLHLTAGVESLSQPSTTASTPPSGAIPTPRPSRGRSVLSQNQQELGQAGQFPRTWVPLASVSELDPDRPNRLYFLGQAYVAYRNNQRQWVVVDDACPHRLAPLSEGRINRDRNSLQCSYHGWEFDSAGQCQNIPQLKDVVPCHVQSYSVMVEKSALFAWLWPEDPLSVSNIPEANPEGIMEGLPTAGKTFTRDLPYGWDTLLENIGDPSHVPFAHHGLQGTRDDAIPINMTLPSLEGVSSKEWGFSISFGDRTMKKRRQTNMVFRAPFVVQYQGQFEASEEQKGKSPPGSFDLSAVMIPTRPGYSRLMLFTGKPEGKASNNNNNTTLAETTDETNARRTSLVGKIFQILPVWVIHILNNKFLDTDLAFLYYQERERERRGKDVQAFFLPAPSDRSVRAIREWVLQYAHIPGPLPSSLSQDVLFDRYTQHTQHCRHCSQAFQGVQVWRTNAYRVLGVSILFLPYLSARIVAVGCLAVLRILAWIEDELQKGGFDHATND